MCVCLWLSLRLNILLISSLSPLLVSRLVSPVLAVRVTEWFVVYMWVALLQAGDEQQLVRRLLSASTSTTSSHTPLSPSLTTSLTSRTPQPTQRIFCHNLRPVQFTISIFRIIVFMTISAGSLEAMLFNSYKDNNCNSRAARWVCAQQGN